MTKSNVISANKVASSVTPFGLCYWLIGSNIRYTVARDDLGKHGVVTSLGPWTGEFDLETVITLTECASEDEATTTAVNNVLREASLGSVTQ